MKPNTLYVLRMAVVIMRTFQQCFGQWWPQIPFALGPLEAVPGFDRAKQGRHEGIPSGEYELNRQNGHGSYSSL